MKFRSVAATVLLGVSLVPAARANMVSGSLWHVPEAVVNSPTGATPGNVPGTTPDVTFTVNSPLNFSGSNASVGTWLASGGASILTGSAATLASRMDNSSVGSIVRFTGSVTVVNGQTFTVAHDDGLTLIIGGVNLGFNPGPTSPVVSTATYTGPSGNEAFDLVYAECCAGPAVLNVDLPLSSAPAPDAGSTLMLLGAAVGGLAGLRRRHA